MNPFRTLAGPGALLAPLALLATAAPGAAQTVTQIALLPDAGCEVRLPLPPADPSTHEEHGCYYFGNYTWNDGSGAGNVSGRIYWPSTCGDGTTQPPGELALPVALLMHGDGHHYNDYSYLVRHLALNGFIVATIANGGTNLERSAQALTYLNFLTNHWGYSAWVDTDRVALIGHSRGGEAVLTLARRIQELALPYDVDAVISLAPTDSDEGGLGVRESLTGTQSPAVLGIYGTHDEDVTGYCLSGGLPECGTPLVEARGTVFSLFDRAGSEYSTEPLVLSDAVVTKSVLFVEGASHNGWRDTCGGFPPPGVLSCATHRELAKGYMSAFLRWRLRGQELYRFYFTGDYSLPVVDAASVAVHTTYQEGFDRRVVDNFESAGWGTNNLGGVLLKSDTVTVEEYGDTWDHEPTLAHDTGSLVVSWSPPGFVPYLRWVIPDGQTLFNERWRDVTDHEYLSFRAGQVFGAPDNTPGASKDFFVQLRDSTGALSPWVRVSDYTDLPYPSEVQVIKYGIPILVATSAMKTVRIPLCRFTGIDQENVSSIYFYFSAQGSTSGELILDNLEFTH